MESYFKIKDYLVYLVYNISVIITPYTCIRMLDSILQIPWKKVKSYANTHTWSKNSANSQCKAWICKKYHGY
jgi:hypothetical protein